jgi:hypothetical protein
VVKMSGAEPTTVEIWVQKRVLESLHDENKLTSRGTCRTPFVAGFPAGAGTFKGIWGILHRLHMLVGLKLTQTEKTSWAGFMHLGLRGHSSIPT